MPIGATKRPERVEIAPTGQHLISLIFLSRRTVSRDQSTWMILRMRISDTSSLSTMDLVESAVVYAAQVPLIHPLADERTCVS